MLLTQPPTQEIQVDTENDMYLRLVCWDPRGRAVTLGLLQDQIKPFGKQVFGVRGLYETSVVRGGDLAREEGVHPKTSAGTLLEFMERD